jgi:beta-galactosidase
LGDQIPNNWTIYPLPLDDVSQLKFEPEESVHCPAFYRGKFNVASPKDSFLSIKWWTKGVCWINGFNIGRYWDRGPQKTLYVPKPLFHEGDNEIVILELDKADESHTIEFLEQGYW